MKSVLVRPLFVNPQAYNVLPELYMISNAEPIDTSDTYTIQVNTTCRIEYKLLQSGSEVILHLDLYTVDGSCILGEWYLGNNTTDDITINIVNI